MVSASPSLVALDSPSLSLELVSRPESLTLVRGMLGGLGELLTLDPELLDDVKTAVSEAANNVVMHAYGEGEGPLAVHLYLRPAGIGVLVRDQGSGLVASHRSHDDHHLGIGMPVIQALARRVEFRRALEGGTEVWMEFSAERDGQALYGSPEPASLADDWIDAQAGEVKVSVSPVALLDGVLGRLARAAAAHARFSLDRFSDIYLVTDALAALARRMSARTRVGFCLDADARSLTIALGPLRPGTGDLLRSDDPAFGSGSPLALLSDELEVELEDDGNQRLRVMLRDSS